MDSAQVFIFDLVWVFFAAWGTALAAASAIAFGRDLLPFGARRAPESIHLSRRRGQ